MASLESDIKALRDEQQQLSTRILRFGIVSLTILFALFLTISHAYRQVRNEAIDQKIEEAIHIKNITGNNVEIPEVLLLLWVGEFPGLTSEPTGSNGAGNPPTPEEIASADKRRGELEAEFKKAVQDADKELNIEPSMFGLKLPLNLREWALVLPLIFLLSASYLSILLAKMRVINKAAAHRVSTQSRADLTTLDQLQFAGPPNQTPAYSTFPLQFQKFIYFLCVASFFLYLASIGRFLLYGFVALLAVAFLQLFLIVAFYSFAYAHYATTRLEGQLSELINIPSTNRITRLWNASKNSTAKFARKIPALIALPSGSALILMTLVLTIGLTASSCEKPSEPRAGYELALRRPGVYWYSSTFPQDIFGGGMPDNRLNAVGRSVYLLSLGLAVFTIALLSLSLVYTQIFRQRLLLEWAFRLSGIVTVFLTVDYALNVTVFARDLTILKIPLFTGTMLLWWVCRAFKRTRALWLKVRSVLVVVYLPLVINALFFLVWREIFSDDKTTGLFVYLVGAALLSLGYMRLASESDKSEAPGSY